MNRQLGPSIVLSFLIVGFFAIALYQPEPRGKGKGKGQGSTGAADRALGDRKAAAAAPAPSHGSSKVTARASARAQSASVEVSHAEALLTRPRSGSRSMTSHSPSAHADETATPSTNHAENQPAALAESLGAQPAASTSIPSSVSLVSKTSRPQEQRRAGARPAFTTVQADETLEAVAIRVYGAANEDEVDSLWRANRDVLPRIDSPLKPGTLLRTP